MSRERLKAMSDIRQVRDVQHLAEQMRLGQAEAARRRLEDQQALRRQELEDSVSAWRDSLTMGGVGFAISALRGQAVVDCEARQKEAAASLEKSEEECRQSKENWRATQARLEIAQSLERLVRRHVSKKEDEARTGEFADRFAGRLIK